MSDVMKRIEEKYGIVWRLTTQLFEDECACRKPWPCIMLINSTVVVKLARALVESLNYATFAARKAHVKRTLEEVASD